MTQFLARVRVVLTSAVTFITLAMFVLLQVAAELPEPYAVWVARAVVVLTSLVAIIRRVQPVFDKAQRGLLPTIKEG